jgi:integrase
MAHIDKRKTKSGEWRYEVRYRGTDGRERTETKRTRKLAEHRLTEVHAELLRGTWIDPRRAARPLREVAVEWLAANADKRPSAWARDESVVRVHIEPAIGDHAIGKIIPDDVRGLVGTWRQNHAPRTVKRMYGVLRAILNYAVERELIVVSPCRGISLPKAEPLSRTVVTPEQLNELADALGAEFGIMAYLGAVLGLRWGECAGLRVGRVDFLHAKIEVAEQITRGRRGAIVTGPPKSDAGRRTLSVPQPLMDLLSAHLALRGVSGADPDALVFTMPGGGALRYEHWRTRTWLPACDLVGLNGLTFHDLRRANATALVLDGVDLKTAQTRLGHSDPRLTLAVYAQATTAADRAAADRLGERFFGSAAG